MSSQALEMINAQNEISEILRNPSKVYDELIENNPDFQRFVKENEGKTIEQIADKYDIDVNLLI